MVMIVLRVIHIFAGMAWFGSALFYVRFLQPTVQATGAEGAHFIERMRQLTPIDVLFPITGMLTFLSGLIMYAIISGGFQSSWITTPYGLALTIGAIFGIAEVVNGAVVQGRLAGRLQTLDREIQSAGGTASPAQASALRRLQEKVMQAGVRGVIFLTCALLGMSIAQYL